MTTDTLADGIWLCERLAPAHPGVAALLADYRRLQGESKRLQREVNFDAQLMPQDAAEIVRLRADNDMLRAALEAVEWVDLGYNAEGKSVHCIWCWAEKRQGHVTDCQRQLALGLTP
jgi:hypothetical protein